MFILCYIFLFRFTVQNYKKFINRLHGVLNVIKKITLLKWTVNRETNLMNLIRL